MIIGYRSGSEPDFPISECLLLDGFAYGPVKAQIHATMGAGLAKVRPRFTVAPWLLQGGMVITTADKQTLDHFFVDTLKNGSLPFKMSDPLNPAKKWLWRFQTPLSYSYVSPGYFRTTLTLDRLPWFSIAPPECTEGLTDLSANHLVDHHGNCLVP